MQYYINEQAHLQKDLKTKRNHLNLHNEVRDWSKSLFETFLKPDQLNPLLTRGQTFLMQILAKSSSYFHRNISKHYKLTLIFLANYHKLMHIYSLKYHTPITNDMALHFILLLGCSRLKDNKIDEARNVFKHVWQYVNIKSCDKVLVSVALSNLTFLHLNNQKPFKALQSSLKCIELIGEHLSALKRQNLRHQIVEDSVVLINSLILCRKALLKIVSITQKSFYAELYRYINEIGYKCSKKYLGENSDFTKVFANYKSHGTLPVFFEESEEQSIEKTTMQQKILQQLEGIHEALKTKRQPAVIYVNKPQIIEQPPLVKEPSVIKPPPESQPSSVSDESEIIVIIPEQPVEKDSDEQQIKAGTSISFNINGWTIQGHLLRPKSLAQKMASQSFGEFILGTLVLQYAKKRKQMKEVISIQRLQKILALIDYESSVLYEYVLKRVNDSEFFNIFIFPHIDIGDEGQLQFMVQKKPIMKPYQVQFLSTKSLIFVNYILGNTLRIKISPLDTSLSLHINVELRLSTFLKLFEINQQLPELIHSVYEKIKEFYYQKQIEIPDLKRHEMTQVTVKDLDFFKKVIIQFLKDFEVFLSEVQQEEDEDFRFGDFLSNYEDQIDENILITFNESKPNPKGVNNKNPQKSQQMDKFKGRFNLCKYLPNIHSIQIFCQNNFSTFNVDSQSRAKGTTMIYADKFEADFGVPLQFFEKQHLMKSILQIVVKRYQLKMFFSPLRTHDEELYNQNAIFELPLICKSYKRTAVEDENGYMVPVTISHLTVNNQIPLAFRVDVYFPFEGCAQYSILIKVHPSFWEKPVIQEPPKVKTQQQKAKQTEEEEQKQNVQHLSQDYGFKKDYFLIEWCQIEGYEQMMRIFSVEDMKILLKGSQLRFYSLERLFHDFK